MGRSKVGVAVAGLIFLIGLFLALSLAPAKAAWMRLSDSALVDQSDLIVVGRLTGQRLMMFAAGDRRHDLAVIQVDRVLKGRRSRKTVYLVLPGDDVLEVTDQRAQPVGLWYLRRHPSGLPSVYTADHPQRFLPLELADTRIEVLSSARR